MEFKHLEIFTELVENLSFSTTAANLRAPLKTYFLVYLFIILVAFL
ncbi:hypothetical protein [Treponema pedis]